MIQGVSCKTKKKTPYSKRITIGLQGEGQFMSLPLPGVRRGASEELSLRTHGSDDLGQNRSQSRLLSSRYSSDGWLHEEDDSDSSGLLFRTLGICSCLGLVGYHFREINISVAWQIQHFQCQ
ncbi:hypothetical protein VTO42DRAFT_8417 [Malbranchea cinnamomea]